MISSSSSSFSILGETPSIEDQNKQIPLAALVKNWDARVLVLFTEDRVCRTCGKHWDIPDPHVMVEWQHRTQKTSKVILRVENSPAPYGLPQETRRIKTSCEACPSCFLEISYHKNGHAGEPPRHVFNGMNLDIGSTEELDKLSALDKAILEDVNKAIEARNAKKGVKKGDKGYVEKYAKNFSIKDI